MRRRMNINKTGIYGTNLLGPQRARGKPTTKLVDGCQLVRNLGDISNIVVWVGVGIVASQIYTNL